VGSPEGRADGIRRVDGVSLIWASLWNYGNQSF